ncbi:MAG: histidinol dehydrogenase [Desulfobacterales bacterium]
MHIVHYPSRHAEKRIQRIISRKLSTTRKLEQTVYRIIAKVAKDGDSALVEFARKFDTPELTVADLEVGEDEFRAAAKAVVPEFITSLKRAITQITVFHQRQRENSWMTTDRPGVLLGQMVHPVDRAGIYVPGGQGGSTPLVSSVLMGAIPARIAGVAELVMATPGSAQGTIDPHLLVAAREVGIDHIYKVGSAWAIAALAQGTATIPKVDVIVGPGNIYVTLAKKMLAGSVGIDMIAGPSEILIIADQSADPGYVAADLLSQAEHDVLASAILITDAPALAAQVKKALARQVETLARREIARASLEKFSALIQVPDLAQAFELANQIAPEHLELIIADPMNHLHAVRNAGAVFVGPFTPEPVGDYIAGPNHVLPTAGTARFSSALSVSTFTKKISLLRYTREALRNEAPDIMRLAETEGLTGHANAVKLRLAAHTPKHKQP